jgi:hypothetical protein
MLPHDHCEQKCPSTVPGEQARSLIAAKDIHSASWRTKRAVFPNMTRTQPHVDRGMSPISFGQQAECLLSLEGARVHSGADDASADVVVEREGLGKAEVGELGDNSENNYACTTIDSRPRHGTEKYAQASRPPTPDCCSKIRWSDRSISNR